MKNIEEKLIREIRSLIEERFNNPTSMNEFRMLGLITGKVEFLLNLCEYEKNRPMPQPMPLTQKIEAQKIKNAKLKTEIAETKHTAIIPKNVIKYDPTVKHWKARDYLEDKLRITAILTSKLQATREEIFEALNTGGYIIPISTLGKNLTRLTEEGLIDHDHPTSHRIPITFWLSSKKFVLSGSGMERKSV